MAPPMGGYFMPVDRRDIARDVRENMEGLWSWSPQMEGITDELRRIEHFGADECFGAIAPPYLQYTDKASCEKARYFWWGNRCNPNSEADYKIAEAKRAKIDDLNARAESLSHNDPLSKMLCGLEGFYQLPSAGMKCSTVSENGVKCARYAQIESTGVDPGSKMGMVLLGVVGIVGLGVCGYFMLRRKGE